ncbi:MAG: YbhN family protein [Mycobacteriales bacterium]
MARLIRGARWPAALVAAGAVTYWLAPSSARSGATVRVLQHANWWWLPAIVVAGVLTHAMAALALTAAAHRPAVDRRLRYRDTFLAQFAATAVNRVTPAGVGAMAVNVRYLTRTGATTTEAATAVGLASTAGFVVHTGALALVAPMLGRGVLGGLAGGLVGGLGEAADFDGPWPLMAGTGVTAVTAMAASAPWWRRWGRWLAGRFGPYLRSVHSDLTSLLASPARAAMLCGGLVGISLAHAAGLAFALAAVGASTGFGTVLVVYLTGAAIGSASPTPSGIGPLEAALAAGLAAGGTPGATALAGVLLYRLVTFWLPVVPGGLAFHWLRRAGSL